MTSRDFAYWLQGFFEVNGGSPAAGLTQQQCCVIQRHLSMVFAHEIDPSMGPPKHQEMLNPLHTIPATTKEIISRC